MGRKEVQVNKKNIEEFVNITKSETNKLKVQSQTLVDLASLIGRASGDAGFYKEAQEELKKIEATITDSCKEINKVVKKMEDTTNDFLKATSSL